MKIVVILAIVIQLSVAEYSYYRPTSSVTSRAGYDGNNLEWSNYGYSVDEGTCGGSKLVDEDIIKKAEPYTYRQTTYNWSGRGMYHLKCVRVLNRMPRDKNAAEARIVEGGVGQDSVRIELRSQPSQDIHFHIQLWGEEVTPSGSHIAIMSRGPENILYMKGKKYCQC